MYKFICANITKPYKVTSSYKKLASTKKFKFCLEENASGKNAPGKRKCSLHACKTAELPSKESTKFFKENSTMANALAVSSISKRYYHLYSINSRPVSKRTSERKSTYDSTKENYDQQTAFINEISCKRDQFQFKPMKTINRPQYLSPEGWMKRIAKKRSSKSDVGYHTHVVRHNIIVNKRYKIWDGSTDKSLAKKEKEKAKLETNKVRGSLPYTSIVDHIQKNKFYAVNLRPECKVKPLKKTDQAMKTSGKHLKSSGNFSEASNISGSKEKTGHVERHFGVKSHPTILHAAKDVKMKLKLRFVQLLKRTKDLVHPVEASPVEAKAPKDDGLISDTQAIQSHPKALTDEELVRKNCTLKYPKTVWLDKSSDVENVCTSPRSPLKKMEEESLEFSKFVEKPKKSSPALVPKELNVNEILELEDRSAPEQEPILIEIVAPVTHKTDVLDNVMVKCDNVKSAPRKTVPKEEPQTGQFTSKMENLNKQAAQQEQLYHKRQMIEQRKQNKQTEPVKNIRPTNSADKLEGYLSKRAAMAEEVKQQITKLNNGERPKPKKQKPKEVKHPISPKRYSENSAYDELNELAVSLNKAKIRPSSDQKITSFVPPLKEIPAQERKIIEEDIERAQKLKKDAMKAWHDPDGQSTQTANKEELVKTSDQEAHQKKSEVTESDDLEAKKSNIDFLIKTEKKSPEGLRRALEDNDTVKLPKTEQPATKNLLLPAPEVADSKVHVLKQYITSDGNEKIFYTPQEEINADKTEEFEDLNIKQFEQKGSKNNLEPVDLSRLKQATNEVIGHIKDLTMIMSKTGQLAKEDTIRSDNKPRIGPPPGPPPADKGKKGGKKEKPKTGPKDMILPPKFTESLPKDNMPKDLSKHAGQEAQLLNQSFSDKKSREMSTIKLGKERERTPEANDVKTKKESPDKIVSEAPDINDAQDEKIRQYFTKLRLKYENKALEARDKEAKQEAKTDKENERIQEFCTEGKEEREIREYFTRKFALKKTGTNRTDSTPAINRTNSCPFAQRSTQQPPLSPNKDTIGNKSSPKGPKIGVDETKSKYSSWSMGKSSQFSEEANIKMKIIMKRGSEKTGLPTFKIGKERGQSLKCSSPAKSPLAEQFDVVAASKLSASFGESPKKAVAPFKPKLIMYPKGKECTNPSKAMFTQLNEQEENLNQQLPQPSVEFPKISAQSARSNPTEGIEEKITALKGIFISATKGQTTGKLENAMTVQKKEEEEEEGKLRSENADEPHCLDGWQLASVEQNLEAAGPERLPAAIALQEKECTFMCLPQEVCDEVKLNFADEQPEVLAKSRRQGAGLKKEPLDNSSKRSYSSGSMKNADSGASNSPKDNKEGKFTAKEDNKTAIFKILHNGGVFIIKKADETKPDYRVKNYSQRKQDFVTPKASDDVNKSAIFKIRQNGDVFIIKKGDEPSLKNQSPKNVQKGPVLPKPTKQSAEEPKKPFKKELNAAKMTQDCFEKCSTNRNCLEMLKKIEDHLTDKRESLQIEQVKQITNILSSAVHVKPKSKELLRKNENEKQESKKPSSLLSKEPRPVKLKLGQSKNQKRPKNMEQLIRQDSIENLQMKETQLDNPQGQKESSKGKNQSNLLKKDTKPTKLKLEHNKEQNKPKATSKTKELKLESLPKQQSTTHLQQEEIFSNNKGSLKGRESCKPQGHKELELGDKKCSKKETINNNKEDSLYSLKEPHFDQYENGVENTELVKQLDSLEAQSKPLKNHTLKQTAKMSVKPSKRSPRRLYEAVKSSAVKQKTAKKMEEKPQAVTKFTLENLIGKNPKQNVTGPKEETKNNEKPSENKPKFAARRAKSEQTKIRPKDLNLTCRKLNEITEIQDEQTNKKTSKADHSTTNKNVQKAPNSKELLKVSRSEHNLKNKEGTNIAEEKKNARSTNTANESVEIQMIGLAKGVQEAILGALSINKNASEKFNVKEERPRPTTDEVLKSNIKEANADFPKASLENIKRYHPDFNPSNQLMTRGEFLELKSKQIDLKRPKPEAPSKISIEQLGEEIQKYLDKKQAMEGKEQRDRPSTVVDNGRNQSRSDLNERIQKEIEINMTARADFFSPEISADALNFKIKKMAELIANDLRQNEVIKEALEKTAIKLDARDLVIEMRSEEEVIKDALVKVAEKQEKPNVATKEPTDEKNDENLKFSEKGHAKSVGELEKKSATQMDEESKIILKKRLIREFNEAIGEALKKNDIKKSGKNKEEGCSYHSYALKKISERRDSREKNQTVPSAPELSDSKISGKDLILDKHDVIVGVVMKSFDKTVVPNYKILGNKKEKPYAMKAPSKFSPTIKRDEKNELMVDNKTPQLHKTRKEEIEKLNEIKRRNKRARKLKSALPKVKTPLEHDTEEIVKGPNLILKRASLPNSNSNQHQKCPSMLILPSNSPKCVIGQRVEALSSTLDRPIKDVVMTVPKHPLNAGNSKRTKTNDPLAKYRHLRITYMSVQRPQRPENEKFLPAIVKEDKIGKLTEEQKNAIINYRFELLKRLGEIYREQEEGRNAPKPPATLSQPDLSEGANSNKNNMISKLGRSAKSSLKFRSECGVDKKPKVGDSRKSGGKNDKTGPGGSRSYSTEDPNKCTGTDNSDSNPQSDPEPKGIRCPDMCNESKEAEECQGQLEPEPERKEKETTEFNIMEEVPHAFGCPSPRLTDERAFNLYHRYHKMSFFDLHESLHSKRVFSFVKSQKP